MNTGDESQTRGPGGIRSEGPRAGGLRRSPLFLVLFTVFVDLIGFGVIVGALGSGVTIHRFLRV